MALPLIINVPETERLELFARKLHYCSKVFDFTDEDSEFKSKEIKRVYLQEVTDYIDSAKGVLNQEPIYAISIVMIGKNIFRAFPPLDPTHDEDEDGPIYDPAWPHLHLVYKYFLHFIGHPDFQPSIAKKFMDDRFVTRFMHALGSSDHREREHLKGILHKIYGRFLGLRGCVRKVTANIIMSHVYEDIEFAGLAEILEVFGSIINGYAIPLKEQHVTFLKNILLPLHSSSEFETFQPQLVYCIAQYIEKDPMLTKDVLRSLFKYWPRVSAQKEVLFLGELEELIDIMQPEEFQKLQSILLRKISICCRCSHFQVAERALYLWENEYILSLIEVNAKVAYPAVLPSLVYASKRHWNESVRTLATTVKNSLKESNYEEYSRVCGLSSRAGKQPTEMKKGISLWQRAFKVSTKAK